MTRHLSASARDLPLRSTHLSTVSPKSDQVFLLGGCASGGVLPLPAPAKQTHRAEAGSEEWEGRGQGRWRIYGIRGCYRDDCGVADEGPGGVEDTE